MTGSGPLGSSARLRPPSPVWVRPDPPEPDVVDALVEGLSLPRALCTVLATRGVVDVGEAKDFLRPRIEHLHDPRLLVDGEVAAGRVAAAIDLDETILVHGDYDVDGICATALLTRWLTRLGARVVPFVPHRLRDGYDFGPAGLAKAVEVDAKLIITVDCGTVAHEAVRDAAARGIDVVVTDHHTVAGDVPAAAAVVNPQRPDCGYPDKGLCGAGVAYKLCELVADARGADPAPLTELLDLVALATVADLVPLQGENRVFVHFGLRRFRASRVVGLRALLEASGVDESDVTAGRLGFVVAPRINAAGRIGDSADALRLLLTEEPAEARRLASQLDTTNRERQEEDQRTLAEALEELERTYDPERDFGVVLAAEGWHPGVIGIVASRVVERIHRPVVMIALDGERGRGSARSVPGFHLYEAIAQCEEHLTRFGGHKQAAGMDVPRGRLADFREAFNRAARARLDEELLRPRLRTDLDLPLGDANLELVRWLEYLGPHGMGNPGPVFVARGAVLECPRTVGADHLKVTLRDGDARVDAIGFGLAEHHPPNALGDEPRDVAFKLERNEYRGTVRAQARLLAIAPAGGTT